MLRGGTCTETRSFVPKGDPFKKGAICRWRFSVPGLYAEKRPLYRERVEALYR